MKIITWNCNMAFRKKAEHILKHQPDILIVPECEHPDKLKFNERTTLPNDTLWYGTNLNKGLGVFSYSDYKFELMDVHNPEIKNVLPVLVTGGKYDFTLIAVWANNPQDPDCQYIGQVWKAIIYYDSLIKNERTIIIGDFNSNVIWDKRHRIHNHCVVVDLLSQKGIFSTYHTYFKQEQGKELHPTLFMFRHQTKPYDIDYCFASSDFIERITSVEVGSYEDWTKHSDHKPLITNFNL